MLSVHYQALMATTRFLFFSLPNTVMLMATICFLLLISLQFNVPALRAAIGSDKDR